MSDYSLYSGDTGDEDERDRVLREFIGEQAARPYHDEETQLSAADAPTTQVEETGRALQRQGEGGGEDDALKQALRDRAMRDLSQDNAAPTERQTASPDWTAAIGSVAGLGLDAVMNRGRGAGQIVSATAQNMDADRRAEQQRLDHLAEIAARHRDKDPLVAYLGLGNLDQRRFENENIKAGNLAQRTRQIDSNVAPDSEPALGKTALTERNSNARTTGRLEANHNANDTIADDKADVTTAVTDARNNANHEHAPTKSADEAHAALEKLTTTSPQRVSDAAGIAIAQGEARQPLIERNRAEVDAIRDQNKRDDLLGKNSTVVPIPGSIVDVPDAFQASTANPAARDKVIQHVNLTNKVDRAMGDLIDVQNRIGSKKIIPGTEKAAYEAAYQAAIGAFTDVAHSGVLNAGEYPRYAERIPGTFEPKDEMLDLYNRYLGSGTEESTSLSRLRGLRGELRSLGNAGLRGYGVRADYDGTAANGGPALPAGQKPTANQPQAASPAALDVLPVTGKPAQIPRDSLAPDTGAKAYTVVNRKNGKRFSASLTAQQLSDMERDKNSPYEVVLE